MYRFSHVDNRQRDDRSHLRYPSDLTDEEWGIIEPMIPPAKHGSRPHKVDLREITNGIMYVLSTEGLATAHLVGHRGAVRLTGIPRCWRLSG